MNGPRSHGPLIGRIGYNRGPWSRHPDHPAMPGCGKFSPHDVIEKLKAAFLLRLSCTDGDVVVRVAQGVGVVLVSRISIEGSARFP